MARMAVETAKERSTEAASMSDRRAYTTVFERRVQIHYAPAAATPVRPGITYIMKRHSLCGRKL